MSTGKPKPVVAFFGLTCCAGCQLEILNLEDDLLDVLGHINLVQFRMGSSATHPGPYDVCFVEGSVTNEAELTRLKELREKSKILVAMGSCATTGGVNAIRNDEISRNSNKAYMVTRLILTPSPKFYH